VAGYAFAALRGKKPDVVVVVSPMHYPYYEPLLTTGHDAYSTPLGTIPVHTEALKALDSYLFESIGIRLTRIKNDEEHSLEIELPFLQRSLAAPFSLIPIMMRDQGLRTARALGMSLARLMTEDENMASKQYVLVASSDLSHFYDQESAEILDAEVLNRIDAFDPEGLVRVEEEEKGFACGYGAITAVLFAAKALGADHAQVLRHATSGDITGDYDRVVGYAAAVITRPNS
jgi:AmmeMemoRadiSam system protein B